MPLTQAEKTAALEGLLLTRSRVEKLSAPAESGVYAIYLRTRGLLAPFREAENGLIYVGLSCNLATREFKQHFSSGKTGSSTVRRSVGALLKSELALRAIPRGAGRTDKKNVQHYCFLGEGETRLTDWMHEHLEIGIHASSKYLELEDFLISELRPLLNLSKWPNPHLREIKRWRKMCADEAREARGG